MRIVGNPIQQVLGTYLKQARKTDAVSESPGAKTDEVSVSQQAAEMLKAREALDRTPEVRQDRVDAIREKLAQGYRPDAMAVSEAILRSATARGGGASEE
jgi:flagellar biosynthesis anti-sigma factor FlgM